MFTYAMNSFIIYSEFAFNPAKWPRMQMDEDFSKLSKRFNAMRSVVRVPNLDPKYKISVFASKQVCESDASLYWIAYAASFFF